MVQSQCPASPQLRWSISFIQLKIGKVKLSKNLAKFKDHPNINALIQKLGVFIAERD
jgi:hypothetical protein